MLWDTLKQRLIFLRLLYRGRTKLWTMSLGQNGKDCREARTGRVD
jgi:hypothetical protein